MPSDLHIPAAATGAVPVRSSYRAYRPGMDQGTKYLLFAAAGLGGVLLLGMGSWAVMGGRASTVPVIEADSRPIRIKPDNAGGLQVSGAEDQVMGGQGAATQGMAPAAEAPAPQALRAQMAPPVPSRPAAPVVTAAPVAAPAAPAAPAVVAAPAAPAAPAAVARPAAAGGTVVQLAAVESESAAQAEWQRLARRMPELLGDRRPLVQRTDRDGKAFWRVRTGGFADIADATGFCAKVRAKGGGCSIASF